MCDSLLLTRHIPLTMYWLFLIGTFQLSVGAQLRFHCSFCLIGSVVFDLSNQSHTFICSVMVMTNVFVVWGIQLITLIVFDCFIKVADFLSGMRNFFWLMWSSLIYYYCPWEEILKLHNALPEAALKRMSPGRFWNCIFGFTFSSDFEDCWEHEDCCYTHWLVWSCRSWMFSLVCCRYFSMYVWNWGLCVYMLIPETWSLQKPNDFLLTVDTEQPIYDGINNSGQGWWARTNAPIMMPFMRWLWKEISQLNWELVPTVGHTRPAQLKRKWFPSGLWYSLIGHKHFSQAEPFSPGGAAWSYFTLTLQFSFM